jgi:hypothetical protein
MVAFIPLDPNPAKEFETINWAAAAQRKIKCELGVQGPVISART